MTFEPACPLICITILVIYCIFTFDCRASSAWTTSETINVYTAGINLNLVHLPLQPVCGTMFSGHSFSALWNAHRSHSSVVWDVDCLNQALNPHLISSLINLCGQKRLPNYTVCDGYVCQVKEPYQVAQCLYQPVVCLLLSHIPLLHSDHQDSALKWVSSLKNKMQSFSVSICEAAVALSSSPELCTFIGYWSATESSLAFGPCLLPATLLCIPMQ